MRDRGGGKKERSGGEGRKGQRAGCCSAVEYLPNVEWLHPQNGNRNK